MRYVLVALVAAAGCKSAPTAPPPANQAPPPDYSATANDELGFLPANSDFIVGVDMVALRGSALWTKFQPQIEALGNELEKLGGSCGPNPMNTIERITFGMKAMPNNAVAGVIVAKGVDTTKAVDCFVEQTKKSGGGTARVDRGVGIAEYPNRPGLQAALATVGPSTVVMQLDAAVSHDTMTKVLASGSPLRSSATFTNLFARRERGAAMWGMANGNAPVFNELARSGMRPTSIDGTLTVTDRFTFALRLTMPSPAEAARVKAEVDKVKGPASTMVERVDARVDGATVALDVAITEPQLRALAGMLGGVMGP